MRVGRRSLTPMRVRRDDGAVLRLHRMEQAMAERPDLVGYWVSRGISRALDPVRSAAWLVLGRPPGGYHRVRREPLIRPPSPPGTGPAGVREPRRPLPPTLPAGAEAVPPRTTS